MSGGERRSNPTKDQMMITRILERLWTAPSIGDGEQEESETSVYVDPDIRVDTGSSTSDILSIISNKRRRETIKILSSTNSSHIPLSDLSEMLMVRCEDKDQDELDGTDRKRYYVSLYQTHLDKMEECGLISIDSRGTGRKIIPLEPIHDLKAYIEITEGVLGDWD